MAVGQEHDRLSVAGHLYGARRNGVRGYVVAARMGDVPALEPHAHPIGAGPHGIIAGKKRREFRWREIVVLRARNGAKCRPISEIEPFDPAFVAVARARQAQRQAVARRQCAALPAAEAAADIGRNAAQHGLDGEAALHGEVEHGTAGQ